jgi:hypothetical protein
MNSMEQGPSLEDNSCSFSQEFPGFLWIPKIYYYVDNGPPIVLILSHINPLNAELNPICHLPALLGAHHIFHVSGLRVNSILNLLFLFLRCNLILCSHLHLSVPRSPLPSGFQIKTSTQLSSPPYVSHFMSISSSFVSSPE